MVNINGETWKILLVSPTHPGLRKSNGDLAWGTCNDLNKTIYINDSLSSFYTKKVLCHELTHAAMFSYNIELSLEQEEVLADLIATYGQEIVGMTNIIFKRIQQKGEA
jgi:hypothetical protein